MSFNSVGLSLLWHLHIFCAFWSVPPPRCLRSRVAFYHARERKGWFIYLFVCVWRQSCNLKTSRAPFDEFINSTSPTAAAESWWPLRAMLRHAVATRREGQRVARWVTAAACQSCCEWGVWFLFGVFTLSLTLLIWHPQPTNHSTSWLFTLSCLIHFHLCPEGTATSNLYRNIQYE